MDDLDAGLLVSGGVKIITAAASVATAIVLPPLVPKTLRLIQDAKLSGARQHELEVAHEELERLYEEIKRADEIKTRFFANVSHELRTPVALILGPAEVLLDGELTAQQRRELEAIQRNARTLLSHINGLLDLSKLEAGHDRLRVEPADLAAALRLTAGNFEALAAEQGISLTVEAPNSLTVSADGEKLQRVFLNLLANAFKFVPRGGIVHCRLWTESGRLFAAVRDNGPGVPVELRSAIFERFQQGNDPSSRLHGGTGLGLAIAKEFVELHEGSISVADAPGGGALFTVELPYRPVEAAEEPVDTGSSERVIDLARQTVAVARDQRITVAQEASALPAPNADHDERPLVLVVEDNLEMARYIGTTLANDFRIAFAADGHTALEKASREKPNLILCDVMMPGMSGDELAREFRSQKEFSDTPIVMLTAKADDSLRVRLLEGVVQDFLTKPVGGAELRARVKNLVAVQQNEAALRRTQEALRALTTRLVAGQEQERSRLARELHDGLNQSLVTLSLEIAGVQDRLGEPQETIHAELGKLESMVIDISEDVRRISHRLHPASLEHVGLIAALRSYCVEFAKQTGIKTEFDTSEADGSLSQEATTALFRITQEALTNIAKHSEAPEARVGLRYDAGEVRLSIADTGVGFEIDKEWAKGGLGLISMDERCRALGGTLSIKSNSEHGTVVEARIPLANPPASDVS